MRNEKGSTLTTGLIILVVVLIIGLGITIFMIYNNSEEVDTERTGGETLNDETEEQVTCVEEWACTDWDNCIAGEQTRKCRDLNNCDSEDEKPFEIRECIEEEDSSEDDEDDEIEEPQVELIDCGEEILIAEAGIPTSHDSTDQVQAVESSYPNLVCFGEKLLDGCAKAKIKVIGVDSVELGIFESVGLDDNQKCVGRITFTENSVGEGNEQYVGTYVDCPLDAIDIDVSDDFFETHPANLAFETIFNLKLFNFHEGSGQCSGTFFDV